MAAPDGVFSSAQPRRGGPSFGLGRVPELEPRRPLGALRPRCCAPWFGGSARAADWSSGRGPSLRPVGSGGGSAGSLRGPGLREPRPHRVGAATARANPRAPGRAVHGLRGHSPAGASGGVRHARHGAGLRTRSRGGVLRAGRRDGPRHRGRDRAALRGRPSRSRAEAGLGIDVVPGWRRRPGASEALGRLRAIRAVASAPRESCEALLRVVGGLARVVAVVVSGALARISRGSFGLPRDSRRRHGARRLRPTRDDPSPDSRDCRGRRHLPSGRSGARDRGGHSGRVARVVASCRTRAPGRVETALRRNRARLPLERSESGSAACGRRVVVVREGLARGTASDETLFSRSGERLPPDRFHGRAFQPFKTHAFGSSMSTVSSWR